MIDSFLQLFITILEVIVLSVILLAIVGLVLYVLRASFGKPNDKWYSLAPVDLERYRVLLACRDVYRRTIKEGHSLNSKFVLTAFNAAISNALVPRSAKEDVRIMIGKDASYMKYFDPSVSFNANSYRVWWGDCTKTMNKYPEMNLPDSLTSNEKFMALITKCVESEILDEKGYPKDSSKEKAYYYVLAELLWLRVDSIPTNLAKDKVFAELWKDCKFFGALDVKKLANNIRSGLSTARNERKYKDFEKEIKTILK